jgi:heme exporter protein C
MSVSDSVAERLPARASAVPAPPRGAIIGPLFWIALVALAAVLVRALFFTPPEAIQGEAQKIFYVHVPAAFMGLYIACPLLAIASIGFLWLRDERLDRVGETSAEIGILFLSVALITGSLWGKPIWGAWWTWDARLTWTLFLWFVLLSYLVLRSAIEEPLLRARFSAVLGTMAALLVPFIHLTTVLFRTLHPQPIVLKPSKPSLSDEMLLTLMLSIGAFVLLFVALFQARLRFARLREYVEHREGSEA